MTDFVSIILVSTYFSDDPIRFLIESVRNNTINFFVNSDNLIGFDSAIVNYGVSLSKFQRYLVVLRISYYSNPGTKF